MYIAGVDTFFSQQRKKIMNILFFSHFRDFLVCYMKSLVRCMQFINKMKVLFSECWPFYGKES